ncbi:MAG: AMP-binding protein [Rhodospirillales bacterium]|nr:AMP-binding protein [Rhodospirillales bacterium]MBO6788187.1 AMP-binding protein [Rhodospirillales bacterium]
MGDAKLAAGSADTFPKLLIENARRIGDRPSIREKDLGIWQTWTWGQVKDEIAAMAAGLKAFGFERGDSLAIVGDNRPQLYWAMTAAQALGGTPVPMYQDSVAEEMQFVLEHAEASFAVVEDQEQTDKLLEIMDRCPKLKEIVYENTRGMRHYDQPYVRSLDSLMEAGRKFLAENPGWFEEEAAKGKGSDIAIMLYTSGTTGRPKGVMLSFDNLVITARNGVEWDNLNERDEVLAYLPMAWVGDNIFSYSQSYVAGFCVSCPESSDTVMQDLKEIGPTYFFAPPRIFENILTQVSIRMEDATKLNQWLYKKFMDVARRVGPDLLDGKPVSILDRILYAIGEFLVYGPLKNELGFSRFRLAYTAGEAIGPDIFDFFRSLGVNIKQLYGSTEASVFICMQKDGDIKPDTVGPPATDVELKIADNGEVLFRSPGVFVAYYKNDDATRDTKTEDGWVMTGDAGFFDADGHLKIIDRAKDVGKLNSGGMFAPKYIENKLKFFPYITEAVAFGHERDHAAAFINIDLEAVGNWAERRGIAYSGYTDLAMRQEVYDLVAECVDKVNKDLSEDEALAGSQIKRFLILHKMLDADDGELTRTRKVRRNTVSERYGELINALYSGVDVCPVEATVTFEDGRTGTIKADVKIREAQVYPSQQAQAAE